VAAPIRRRSWRATWTGVTIMRMNPGRHRAYPEPTAYRFCMTTPQASFPSGWQG
jgi:hypothetical protein